MEKLLKTSKEKHTRNTETDKEKKSQLRNTMTKNEKSTCKH